MNNRERMRSRWRSCTVMRKYEDGGKSPVMLLGFFLYKYRANSQIKKVVKRRDKTDKVNM
ncbi:Uncharacterised protein [Leclercia adecarboxylata]|uniref:Uncharacterized protein n=1 Tax=Leclercia adecarboxylata TaxID=83655 RepID=A0A4U9HVF1_9ENTR|nr:Uncharacterised protein [Leclercia adecarboxylata]